MNVKNLALLAAVAATLASCTGITSNAKDTVVAPTESGSGKTDQKLTLEQIDFLAKKNLECRKAAMDEKIGVSEWVGDTLGEVFFSPKNGRCYYTTFNKSSFGENSADISIEERMYDLQAGYTNQSPLNICQRTCWGKCTLKTNRAVDARNCEKFEKNKADLSSF